MPHPLILITGPSLVGAVLLVGWQGLSDGNIFLGAGLGALYNAYRFRQAEKMRFRLLVVGLALTLIGLARMLGYVSPIFIFENS